MFEPVVPVSVCESFRLECDVRINDHSVLNSRLPDLCYNNIGRNGSYLTWLATSLEERRRWPVITASPRGLCSK